MTPWSLGVFLLGLFDGNTVMAETNQYTVLNYGPNCSGLIPDRQWRFEKLDAEHSHDCYTLLMETERYNSFTLDCGENGMMLHTDYESTDCSGDGYETFNVPWEAYMMDGSCSHNMSMDRPFQQEDYPECKGGSTGGSTLYAETMHTDSACTEASYVAYYFRKDPKVRNCYRIQQYPDGYHNSFDLHCDISPENMMYRAFASTDCSGNDMGNDTWPWAYFHGNFCDSYYDDYHEVTVNEKLAMPLAEHDWPLCTKTTCGAEKQSYRGAYCCGNPTQMVTVDGTEMSCQMMKDYYKNHGCCGNPSKEVAKHAYGM